MKILIVEDNMILCGMIEKWLQKAGYEVLTAMDEPGARSILKKNENQSCVWRRTSAGGKWYQPSGMDDAF